MLSPFRRLALATLALLAPLPAVGLRAQVHNGVELVRADLLADTAAVAPGKPFTVGLRLRMAKTWHTYWAYAGDAGLPTKITWELPPGFTAGPFQWPLPEKIESAGDIVNYGYEGEVVLLTEVTPPATLSPGEVTLKGKADWLVCADICVPGGKEVALKLPVGEAREANAETFAKVRAQLPKAATASKDAWQVVRAPGADGGLRLELRGPAGARLVDYFPLPPENVEVGHPTLEPIADGQGKLGNVRLPLLSNPQEFTHVAGVFVVEEGGRRFGLRDDGEVGRVIPNPPPVGASQMPTGGQVPRATTNMPPAGAGDTPSGGGLGITRPTPVAGPLWSYLLYGLLGGLILNVMPCVLPVISLKIFSFVRQANEDPARVWRLGLAYVGGIFAWFLGFAALVVGFKAAGREVGYAFHFQNPLFLLGLSAVVFVFALSLLGVFEIVLPGASLAGEAPREGLTGAFFQGVLATILASACTAPVFGTALGFAFGQPAPVIFAMFAAVALGMGLPFLLLAARPNWLRFLPRPGVWMERVKQLTGFALLATTLWLLYVLGTLRGADGIIVAATWLLALGFGAWLLGNFAGPTATARARAFTWATLAVLALGGGALAVHGVNASQRPGATLAAGATPAGRFSDQLQTALRDGRPVFVDFTAEWCVNCKVNERTVLNTEPVQQALRERNAHFLKADWTDGAEDITRLLRGFGRAGVPLYVVYPAGKPDAPVVLPELLTQGIVLEGLVEADRRAAANRPVAAR